jgi:mono/diheme cytochrome c family protein
MRLLLAILALLGASFWLATSPRLQPAGREPIPGGEPDLRHGRNVFFAGGCPSCHRSPGRESPFELGGGRAIEAPMGTFHPPNISPDPQYGIGAWVPQQFLRALRAGVSPDGSHYYPIFPYTSFERIADADARDLFAFLRTLPPMTGDAPRHRLVFPFQLRRAVGLWKLLFLDGDPFTPDPGRDERWNRGAYLVEALLHCAECHSPRNLLEAIPPDRRFTGGPDPERRVAWIPDLTESETGLRGWSRDELVELLSAGFFTPGYSPRGERMAEVIEDASHLPREDVEAVAEYVLTLAARPSADRGGGVEPPPAVGAPVAIRARLHRTWWEVEYDAAEPDRSFTTANEAHVPAARPVVLELASDEPIDSFCAPGLIDGREPVGAEGTEFRLVAARPGLFRAVRGLARAAGRRRGAAA